MAYFDNNATTPLFPGVVEAMSEALAGAWANPSSPYRDAARVRALMNQAREEMAESFGVNPDDLTFTSSATEANNSVFTILTNEGFDQHRVLLSPVEHPCVSEPVRRYFSDRFSVLSTDVNGCICLDSLESELKSSSNPILVGVMAASNETGVIQPWKQVAQLCSEYQADFHCDATQWIGKMDLTDLSLCSSFTASAHKFGGPKGVGVLVSSKEHPFLLGGGQEKGKRAGTENYPAIEGMRVAWRVCQSKNLTTSERESWRDSFEERILGLDSGFKILGKNAPRLWNTSTFLVPCFDNQNWISKLDKIGFQVSTGSACASMGTSTAPMVELYNLSAGESSRLIRVSSFWDHSAEDWIALGEAFEKAFGLLKDDSSSSSVISI